MTISVFFSYMKIIPTDFPILFWWYFRPFSAHVHAIVWAFKINLGEIRNYGIQNPYQMYRHLWVKIMHLWWRQSLDLTKQQKNNIWPCIQIPRFSRVLIILIWIKVQNVLDASNFSKTQLRNSLKVLKHTFSSVKVKHFLSLKNDDFEFHTILARAGVRAARSNYFLEKFNISAFTEKKNQVKSSSGSCFTAVLSPPS